MEFSKASKLGALLADEKAKEVVIKHFSPALLDHPMLALAKGMSLEMIAKMSGEIPMDILEACDKDLRAL
jgi:hypothetical protein